MQPAGSLQMKKIIPSQFAFAVKYRELRFRIKSIKVFIVCYSYLRNIFLDYYDLRNS